MHPDPRTGERRCVAERGTRRKIVMRVGLLAVAGISIYLLAPSLLEIFSSWPKLRTAKPGWFALAVGFEAASYLALWTLQRIALRTRSWFAVGTSQLAAGAAGSVVPGGGAAATALQYRLLVASGVRASAVGAGLAATWAATTATALALPLVAVLAAAGGTPAPKGLRQVAYIGSGAFVVVAGLAGAALAWDWPLRTVGRAVPGVAAWVRRGDRLAALPERLLEQRDGVRAAFAARPVLAVLAAVGKWAFDYLALVAVLAALGARPEPALVLLAYAAAALLAMIPATPGGLGFVEAGLAGLLRLAGVDVGTAAVATLGYRLVSFWLPLPAGGIAYWLARRRYGR
jgi:uncharacterized membrane protein YbhN (UPF0104 family)